MHESARSRPRRVLLRAWKARLRRLRLRLSAWLRAWKARLPVWLLRLSRVYRCLLRGCKAVVASLACLSVLLRGWKARLPRCACVSLAPTDVLRRKSEIR